MSSDLEDIVTIFVGRSTISNDLAARRDTLGSSLKKIVALPDFEEAIYGHLPRNSQRTTESVLEIIREFVK